LGDPEADGRLCGLAPAVDPQLVEDVFHVRLDRPGTDVQGGGDLGVGEAPDEETQDLLLALRQTLWSSPGRWFRV
jgi:hypothetical protein